jgi:hypothetical protein
MAKYHQLSSSSTTLVEDLINDPEIKGFEYRHLLMPRVNGKNHQPATVVARW